MWNNLGAGNLGDILHDLAVEHKVDLPYNFPERGTPWAVYNLGQIGDICKYMMGDVLGCNPGDATRVVNSGLLEIPPPRICVSTTIDYDYDKESPFGRTCYPRRVFHPERGISTFDPLEGAAGSYC